MVIYRLPNFPRKDDEINIIAWEAVALSLANKAGIQVPEWRIETVARQQILLSRRFDRRKNIRIPFLSAMSILGAKDNEMHSYLEIVDAIRQMSASPKEDLEALWRKEAAKLKIKKTEIDRMASAFEHEDLQKAIT